MYRVEVQIKLIADMLFNRMTPETEEIITTGETGGRTSVEKKIAAAHQKLYRNGNGLVVPRHMLKSVILAGCGMAKLKHGKSALWKYLKPTVFVENDAELGIGEPDYIHQSIIFKKDGKAVAEYRPAIKVGREFGFRLVVYDDNITLKQIRAAIEAAGIYCGIGSFRPEYGRFEVVKCEMINQGVKK